MQLSEILIRQITVTENIVPQDSILGIYLFGSRLYGTATENSDWDFVVINSAGIDFLYESDEIDIHYVALETYKNKLLQHDVQSLEIYYQNTQGNPIKEYDVEFTLDLPTLRKSISSVCSNSFVKFKKKLTLDGEDKYIGIKSLFHSIRIAELGTKIAIGSKNILVTNTYLWERIKEDAEKYNYDWECLHTIYKPIFNEVMSEFRLIAPKIDTRKEIK